MKGWKPLEHCSLSMLRAVSKGLKCLPPEQFIEAAWDFSANHAAIAERTRVLGFWSGVLVVEVPNADWSYQLDAMEPQFLARLKCFLPVEHIEFKAAQQKNRRRQL